jgi:hypothetical protein
LNVEQAVPLKPRPLGANAGAVSHDDYANVRAQVRVRQDIVSPPRLPMSYDSVGLMPAFLFIFFPRTALNRNFMGEGKIHDGVGIDILLAYTSVLRDIKHIPVFSAMDKFCAWTEYEDEIWTTTPSTSSRTSAFDAHTPTWLVLDNRFCLVSGWTLRESGVLDKCRVVGWVKPSHLAKNPFPSVLDRVVKSFNPIPDIGKVILNALIGMTGKRKAQDDRGRFTTSYNEAWTVAGNRNDINSFADGHIAAARSDEVMLDNGFFPIQFLVYDRMRVKLLRLFHELSDNGATVYGGVKTDCFVVSHVPDGFPLVSRERRVENIGKWCREEGTVRAPREAYTTTDNTASASSTWTSSATRAA